MSPRKNSSQTSAVVTAQTVDINDLTAFLAVVESNTVTTKTETAEAEPVVAKDPIKLANLLVKIMTKNGTLAWAKQGIVLLVKGKADGLSVSIYDSKTSKTTTEEVVADTLGNGVKAILMMACNKSHVFAEHYLKDGKRFETACKTASKGAGGASVTAGNVVKPEFLSVILKG